MTANQVSAINALDGTTDGGNAALALATGDGFTLVSATTPDSGTSGSLSFLAVDGSLTAGPNTIGLLAPVPTGGSGWLAMLVVASGANYNGWSGVLAWSQSDLGGNPTTIPAGDAASVPVDPGGQDLILEPAPEPGACALIATSSALLFLLWRRKGKRGQTKKGVKL